MLNKQRVYVGLGCNLGERKLNLTSACDIIVNHPQCSDLVCSSFYETEPMGKIDQPDYLNAAVSFQTDLAPEALLDVLQGIEQALGRVRTGERWGPRTLDLDLLLYGEQEINTERLIVPHAGIAQRSFVLWPLLELAPELIIPGKGPAKTLASQCEQFGIRRLNS